MSRTTTHEEYLAKLKDKPITALDKYSGAFDVMRFSCNECGHIFKTQARRAYNGAKCPLCHKREMSKRYRGSNDVIGVYADYLLIDVSSPKHPDGTMKIDHCDWARIKDMGKVMLSYYGYPVIGVKKVATKVHRIIMDVINEDCEIDHINRDRSDNRRSNLRKCTHQENMTNIKRNGMTGVYRQGKGWISRITHKGKVHNLGYFDNIEIAIGVRKQAEREMLGECNKNNPSYQVGGVEKQLEGEMK